MPEQVVIPYFLFFLGKGPFLPGKEDLKIPAAYPVALGDCITLHGVATIVQSIVRTVSQTPTGYTDEITVVLQPVHSMKVKKAVKKKK